jgi:hypothetical protein
MCVGLRLKQHLNSCLLVLVITSYVRADAHVALGAALLLCVCAGDHALTGLAIGKMLGIAGNNTVITGPEIDTMSDERLGMVRVNTALPGCLAGFAVHGV